MTKRRRRVDGGKHLAARRLDVGLEAFDMPLEICIGGFLGQQRLRRRVPFGNRTRRCLIPACKLQPRRFAPGVEGPHFCVNIRHRRRQRFDLLFVERNLLLQAADFQLAGVRGFAGRGRPAIRFRQIEAQPFKRGLELGHVRRGRRFSSPRIRQSGASRFDGLTEQPIAFRELHLLPAPKLVT